MFYIPFLTRPVATQKSNAGQSAMPLPANHYWGLKLKPYEAIARVVDITDLPPDMVQVEWQASFYRARSLAPGYHYAKDEWVTVICGQSNYLWIEPQSK